MDRIYPKRVPLKTLQVQLESGVFAVPELQREFVWNARKACDLLDSIFRNYPIGTILIWKTSRRNEGQLRKKLHILPDFNPENREILFLVDGQQRLSVLWHVLRGQASSVVNADGKQVNFGSIYFDPQANEGEALFVYRNRVSGEPARRLVPVVDLLSRTWKRRIRGHGPRAMKRIAECRQRIHNYEALLVYCETNDLRQVRDTFVRINSQGMRIGAADRAFARASKFKMRALVQEAQARLKHGFDRVPSETVLQTLALARGGRDLGERAIQRMITELERSESERSLFHREWPKLRDALGMAADFFFYELDVPHLEFLPSEPMLTILTLFFFHNANVRPSRAAKRQLRRWFWATAVGARYTGRGYRPNLVADADFVRRLAQNPKAHAPVYVKVPLTVLRTVEYGRPGPVSNAFFCLLRLNRPRNVRDGSEIPLGEISSRRNRRDKHHIFPRALLKRHKISEDRFNCVLNICYLSARENQQIGQQSPLRYFARVPLNARARNRSLRSHLIPSREDRGIWDRSTKRGFKNFIEDRALLVAKAFERQAEDMWLFERA